VCVCECVCVCDRMILRNKKVLKQYSKKESKAPAPRPQAVGSNLLARLPTELLESVVDDYTSGEDMGRLLLTCTKKRYYTQDEVDALLEEQQTELESQMYTQEEMDAAMETKEDEVMEDAITKEEHDDEIRELNDHFDDRLREIQSRLCDNCDSVVEDSA
jgi:hypothetical protein